MDVILNKDIEMMNDIVYEAIMSGGDSDGPYGNGSVTLKELLTEWLKDKGYDKNHRVEVINRDGCQIMQICMFDPLFEELFGIGKER